MTEGSTEARRPGAPWGGKGRLDQLLVERGLAPSRTDAARLVMAGQVRVDGQLADKPGRVVPGQASLDVVHRSPYVSRGGEKLAGALDTFGLLPAGRRCLDVGASTGGFTDCLLARGASSVVAVDVGRGQLDARLRVDPRVRLLEGCNARRLDPVQVGSLATLATVDVAFISLGKVLPAVRRCLAADGEVLALVKPQFEVGPRGVDKGVVRDPARRAEAILGVARAAADVGFTVRGVCASPLRGPKGNREFFLWLGPIGPGLDVETLQGVVDTVVREAG